MKSFNLIHSIYYYVVIFVCVIAIATSSVSLVQRAAIDLFFPDLANGSSYYYSRPSISCVDQNKGTIQEDENSSYQPNQQNIIKQCEDDRKKQEEMAVKQQRIEQQSTYLYSSLSLIIATVILLIHYLFIRPGKNSNVS